MKKLLLSAITFFAFGFGIAQEDAKQFGFEKGNILLEGNLSYHSTNDKNTDTKTNQFNFNPKVGYFLANNTAVGLELSVGGSKEMSEGTEVKENNFGIGAFGRHYFLELGQRFKTYGEFGLGFGSGKTEIMSGGEYKSSAFNAGLGLGFNYFILESLAINFSLSDILSYSSHKFKDAEAVSEFNTNINVFNNFFTAAQFGLTYKF